MNSTSARKKIKKKTKAEFNKIFNVKTAEMAIGHSLQQHQEKVVKKNLKKKKQVIGAEDVQKSQDEVIDGKKRFKKKQNSDINDMSGAVLGQQHQNNKFLENLKQTSNKNAYVVTTKMDIGHSPPKPQQQQPIEHKCVKKQPKVKQNPSRAVVSHALQQQQHDLEYYEKQAYIFMKTLKRDYERLALIYNFCIKAEQERERQNVEEIDQLKKTYNQMQVERTEIKRKRWCRYCESEATYVSSEGTNFYCSQECEQKQGELVSAVEETFKS